MPERAQYFSDDGPQAFLPPSTGTLNGLPVFTWEQAAAQLTRSGYSWGSALGAPVTVTYAFRATTAGADTSQFPAGVSGFQQFNATQIAVAEEALRLWAEVANINFVRVGAGTTGPGAYSNNASILFGNFTTGPAAFSAFTFLPDPTATGTGHDEGDVWVNVSRDYDANPAAFPFGAHILAHEIGHALGFLHPGDYDGGGNGGSTYQNDAEYYQDTIQYSNMSYFGEANTGAVLPTNAITPMIHDIAAAQRLYGANMTTRTGDSVYGFNSNTGHAAFTITSATQAAVFAIWDAGGNDTLDLSGYTSNSEIDLREESFSSAGGAAHYNISIARGAIIENAIGGAGNDTIIGNAADNRLVGNDGADVMTGGVGSDTLIGGAGADRMDGGAGNDIIYWDAGDDLANVVGGADTDILVFTSGAAPTTFNLVSHGFESAENRLTDTGANAWATQTIFYDSSWRADLNRVVNDDGSRSELDYDQANAYSWVTNFNQYDATGALDINSTVYDSGVTAAFDYDQAHAFNWVSNWVQYTASGAVDINVTVFDSGVTTSNDFDADSAFNWTSNWVQNDAAGLLDLNVTVFDTGVTSAYDFDQTDAFDWSSNWNQYDAGGALDLNVTVFDNGASNTNDFDQASAFNWTSSFNAYDTAGRLDYNVVVYDNGNVATLDYDQANQYSWATIWQLHDSNGNLIGYQGVNDNGTTFGP